MKDLQCKCYNDDKQRMKNILELICIVFTHFISLYYKKMILIHNSNIHFVKL